MDTRNHNCVDCGGRFFHAADLADHKRTEHGTAVRFPVFRDDKGNRFVFPGLYTFEGHTARWMFCRQICAAICVEQEAETFDVLPDCQGMLNFPRVVADAGSSGFFHGSSEVWIIGGPTFDASPETFGIVIAKPEEPK